MFKRLRKVFTFLPAQNEVMPELLLKWQHAMLQSTLAVMIILAVLTVFRFPSQNFPWSIALLTAVLVVLFFWRNLNHTLRSALALFLLFLLTNIIAFFGHWPIVLVLSIGFLVLCSMLLHKKQVLLGWLVGLATLLGWTFVYAFQQKLPIFHLMIDFVFCLCAAGLSSLMVATLRHQWCEAQNLLSQSTRQIKELNEKIAFEKKDVESSLSQMRIATGLAQIAATSSDVNSMQKRMADLIQQRFQLYFVGIFQLDQRGEHAVLQYGTGDQGRRMLSASYRLTNGGFSLVGKVVQARQAKMSYQNDPDTNLFENPFLPETRSELAIPLLSGGTLFGALDVHAIEPDGFDLNTRLVLQEAADMLALALDREYRKLGSTTAPATLQANPVFDHDLAFTHENPVAALRKTESTNVQIPIRLRDRIIGDIEVEIEDKELSKNQFEFLNTISSQTAIALENASLLSQTLQRAERERKVLDITSKISSTNDSQEMLRIALTELSQSLGVEKAQIVLNIPEKMVSPDIEEADTRSLNRKHTTGHLKEP